MSVNVNGHRGDRLAAPLSLAQAVMGLFACLVLGAVALTIVLGAIHGAF